MGISLKGFGDAAGSGTGASVSGISALPPAAAEVRLAPPSTGVSLLHTLDNPGITKGLMGFSVSVSGNTAIVGSPGNDTIGTDSGRAYIFDNTTGNLLHTLDNPNAYGTTASDWFGESVSISGNNAIVGASRENTSSGVAYIFDVTSGSLLHTLDNPNAYGSSAHDTFGKSVSISGNYAIIGARGEDYAGGIDSGKAYIFDVTTGLVAHTLNNPNPFGTPASDNFGHPVSISGNYAIIGANNEDDAGGTASGKAYIFDVTTGNLLHTLDNPNVSSTTANDYFGTSVSISGNHAVVSAPYEDNAGSSSGTAYIFDVTTGNLLHTLDNPNAYDTAVSDFFGNPVSISGNYVIVSAPDEDDAGGLSSGKAYIFDVTTGNLLYTLDNPNASGTSASDNFGYSVSITDTHVLVGAVGENSYLGTAYIYTI